MLLTVGRRELRVDREGSRDIHVRVRVDDCLGVSAGTRVITDSRGLPIAADTPAYGGAIYRLASARALREAVQEEQAP